jgi:hypothetical protein
MDNLGQVGNAFVERLIIIAVIAILIFFYQIAYGETHSKDYWIGFNAVKQNGLKAVYDGGGTLVTID